jgi:phosphopantetheinyl transferase (holo-ACP synthase)
MTGPSVVDVVLRVEEPRRRILLARRDRYWIARAVWASPSDRDRLEAVVLDDAERADLAALPPRARDGRLLGRLAGKAAAREWLVARGRPAPEMRDVRIRNDGTGRPRLEVAGSEPVQVSLAHCGTTAVATARSGHAGVDVEVIERRGPVFARLALTATELRLGERAGGDVDEWVTRAWTIKEAVAKAAGTGLQGRPKGIVVDDVDGAWAHAAGHWVRTAREGGLIVSVVAPRAR